MPIATNEILEEEPLYVNAKQYRRILKRRQARAKLEAEGRIPKERPVRSLLSAWFLDFDQWFFANRNTCTSPDIVMPWTELEERADDSIQAPSEKGQLNYFKMSI